MPIQRAAAIDWEPYQADIIEFYVEQDNTAADTIAYLRNVHGLNVTLKQFKKRFSRCKNITAEDWAGRIIPTIRKRAREHKESDVFIDWKQVHPKRVETAISRYSSRVDPELETVAESMVALDRIRIATPRPAQWDSVPSSIPAAQKPHDKNTEGTTGTERSVCQPGMRGFPEISVVSSQLIFTGKNNLWPEYDPIMPDDGFSIDFDEYFLQRVWEALLIDVVSQAQFDPRLYFRQTTNPIIPSIVGMSSTARRSENGVFTEAASDDQEGSPLSFSPTLSDVLIKHSFPPRVQELLPEREDLSRQIGPWLDSEQGLPLQQMLYVAAYLSSNNLLSNEQTEKFLVSVSEYSYMDVLKSFLRLETPTTQAFRLRLVEAALRLKNINLLRQMQSAGATFNHAAELVIQLDNAEFLDLVVPALDPSLLKGASGGHLLRHIVKTSHVKIAEQLIQAGAEVNICRETTPLWEAVNRNRYPMVKLLARAGADMNRRNSANTSTWRGQWPLATAVLHENISIVKCLIDHGAKCSSYPQNPCEMRAALRAEVWSPRNYICG